MHSKDLWPELLRRARERLATGQRGRGAGIPMTALGERMAPYLRADLVRAAFLYQMDRGWGIDIHFDAARLPPGTPAAIGTPSREPLATAELAIDTGVDMAMAFLDMAGGPVPAAAAPAAFMLFGEAVVVDDTELSLAAPVWQRLVDRLGEALASELALGMLRAAWETIGLDMIGDVPTEDARSRLIWAICLCLQARIARYPLDEAEPETRVGRSH